MTKETKFEMYVRLLTVDYPKDIKTNSLNTFCDGNTMWFPAPERKPNVDS